MINNQKSAFGTPLRKHLVIGATSVVAASAFLGVGVAGASAATVQPTSVATHSSVAVHSHHANVSLIEQLRADLFQGQMNGPKAQALATRIADNSAMFSALPANLKSDLTALKNAPAADAVAQAEHIKSTALAGGYGARIKDLATDLQTAKFPISRSLIRGLRSDLAPNATVSPTGASVTTSGAAEAPMRLLGTEHASVADSVGPQLQTLTHAVPLTGIN
jgi:hypothetical protein